MRLGEEKYESNTWCIGECFDEAKTYLGKQAEKKIRTNSDHINESLILAQDERWRRA